MMCKVWSTKIIIEFYTVVGFNRLQGSGLVGSVVSKSSLGQCCPRINNFTRDDIMVCAVIGSRVMQVSVQVSNLSKLTLGTRPCTGNPQIVTGAMPDSVGTSAKSDCGL